MADNAYPVSNLDISDLTIQGNIQPSFVTSINFLSSNIHVSPTYDDGISAPEPCHVSYQVVLIIRGQLLTSRLIILSTDAPDMLDSFAIDLTIWVILIHRI